MLDSELQTIIQSSLIAGFAARSMTVQVQQNKQPRQFAAPSVPSVFHSIGSPRKAYGWPKYRDVWDDVQQTFVTTRTQVEHTRFSIAGCVAQTPGNPNGPSSSDLANYAMTILQDENFIAQIVAQDCNVFRVVEMPAIWFVDSNGQNALWASFDMIFTHKDVFTTSVGAISDFVGRIDSV